MELLNRDIALMVSGLGKFVSCLHAQQRISHDPKGLFEPDYHVCRKTGTFIAQSTERMPRDAKVLGLSTHGAWPSG